MSNQESSSIILDRDLSSYCDVTAKPSKIISYSEKVLDINGVTLELILVCMKRSFLLVINNMSSVRSMIPEGGGELTREQMIEGFMNSNLALKGLSLAIGQHNTCMINSDNYLDSATLASRLSKKFNENRPVYVANNFMLPYDAVDASEFTTKLYMRIFQFVGSNYRGAGVCENPVSASEDNQVNKTNCDC